MLSVSHSISFVNHVTDTVGIKFHGKHKDKATEMFYARLTSVYACCGNDV